MGPGHADAPLQHSLHALYLFPYRHASHSGILHECNVCLLRTLLPAVYQALLISAAMGICLQSSPRGNVCLLCFVQPLFSCLPYVHGVLVMHCKILGILFRIRHNDFVLHFSFD